MRSLPCPECGSHDWADDMPSGRPLTAEDIERWNKWTEYLKQEMIRVKDEELAKLWKE